MATPNTPINYIPKLSQEGILMFNKSCGDMSSQNLNLREQMRSIDLAYIREQDWTKEHRRAQLANKYGDSTKFQNITVPVVMPQVEAAVAYQSSVFLQGYPIFESSSNPLYEDAALQMNAIIEDQSVRGGWVRELQLFLRDGYKYNLSAVEADWGSIVTASLETDLSYDAKEARPKNIIWEGNILKRLDPYNIGFDSRCALTDIPAKGEFVSYVELYSRCALKDFINKLKGKIVANVNLAFESGISPQGSGNPYSYYTPIINPDALLQQTTPGSTDWMAWASLSNPNPQVQYKNIYEVTTLYGRIIPSDFNLRVPAANTPQVWKFIIVNNSVLISAERQTNAHELIPVLFGQPLEDGLKYQTKSLAKNAEPFQQVSTALLNSSMSAARKSVHDRVFYDPSRIREADINNPNPASKIPVKPSAYGKNINEAFAQVPFRDDQSGVIIQKLAQLSSLVDETTGRNRAQRGLFTKGNRTKEEYVDVMQNASGRDQMGSMLLEAQVFTPLKNILKLNILQYQGGTELYSADQQKIVAVDPIALRRAVTNFKMADGLNPTSKQISSEAFSVALQTIGSNPQLGAGYNTTPMFSYLMKTQGADLKAFEKTQQQVAYEQAVQQWQQSVQMLAEAIAKGGGTFNSADMPPQPTPDQFQYVPGQVSQQMTQAILNPPTVMDQVVAATQQTPQPITGDTTNGAPNS